VKRARKTVADVYTARDQLMDEIDDVVSALPPSLRQLLLGEIADNVTDRHNDVAGYYGKRRSRR
jgi:Cu/Ag efflux pump CusA